MKIAFDLDGTLDKPVVRDLALALMDAGHEVHIITGIFAEAGEWQSAKAKAEKLGRLGLSWRRTLVQDGDFGGLIEANGKHANPATLHILYAADESLGVDYRLRDLGLRKGALCERIGVSLILDDSTHFAEVMQRMHGGLTILHVR